MPNPAGRRTPRGLLHEVGATHPEEMYIVGAHMDATDGAKPPTMTAQARRWSWGWRAYSPLATSRPNGRSGSCLEQRREGSNGAYAYVASVRHLQGRRTRPDPASTEPRWLGVIQHDMMLSIMECRGRMERSRRSNVRSRDINMISSVRRQDGEEAQKLAWTFYAANEAFASDYPLPSVRI